eukprot:CAMPEP_0206277182 /NCGR_PEP_ID=MMETSP0047_2-20121206/36722_1 /ASSEMBLY_ACC=CAM_ASM_000192 /TAXON_ID=195065 /ORGANISM="Chroomonas mesostigmatica_cf, Strain CCMP1168" /LENGTH=125 /DNA_ID=CAMNT_0053706787 /DNA_START=60 /DNA_END=436 /DNA_ORIENTATION=+
MRVMLAQSLCFEKYFLRARARKIVQLSSACAFSERLSASSTTASQRVMSAARKILIHQCAALQVRNTLTLHAHKKVHSCVGGLWAQNDEARALYAMVRVEELLNEIDGRVAGDVPTHDHVPPLAT